ncbi:MAG: IPT/TIG domain-containing protein [Thermoanaerobaculum sp.]|nr:IPT/TIG domain-containing protein [Thermoanaerobaculum sp.]MDW7968709.1 IPT/TIG domain-containing protein [Thermoanaerobaculum sp.]
MKNSTLFAIPLVGAALVVFSSCSKSDSPTAPRPSPTPQAASLTLTVSATSAVTGEAVEARATVRQGTSPVPDGTVVTFTLPNEICEGVPCHSFLDNNEFRVSKETRAGVASALWTSVKVGDVTVTASSSGATASAQVRFSPRVQPVPAAAAPRFFSITPSSGSARGGYTASISGQWLCKSYLRGVCHSPADVTLRQVFKVVERVIIEGNRREVIYREVNRDVALRVRAFSGEGTNDTLVVEIPEADPAYLDQSFKVDLVLANGVGGPITVVNAFMYLADLLQAGYPQIFTVTPDSGTWQGGDEVLITGQDLCVYYWTSSGTCATSILPFVWFTPGGDAEVRWLSPDGRAVRVRTPRVDIDPISRDWESYLTFSNLSGQVSRPFKFRADFVLAESPTIFGVSPNQGSWQGGEEVTVSGVNLCVRFLRSSGLCDTTVPPAVRFTPPGADAMVTWVSPDGRALRVTTPRASVAPITQDIESSISVTNTAGTGNLANSFVYVANREVAVTPVLHALSPNAGPIEGGTRVTIYGTGFQYPVQVLFGDREAQVVSSNFNQIVCIAPSIAATQPTTPTTVDVSVKNVLTGKTSSNTLPYRYGEAMFVSAITPNTGYILGWNNATIYGQGFVAPVQVLVTVAGLTKEAQVLSVSGTSIQVKMPPFQEAVSGQGCTPVVATFSVTNIGSNLRVTGPGYTYLCSGGISGP